MMNVITIAALLVNSTAQHPQPQWQPLREGTAAIYGRVLDALSEEAVVDLEVRLIEFEPGPLRPRPTLRSVVARTDAGGRFSLPKVPAGSYQIEVTGKTHLRTCLGAPRESTGPCELIQLGENQIRRDANVLARPAAIIRGNLVDHDGRAVAGANVGTVAVGSAPHLGYATSDSLGRFEIGGIPPGDVVLSAEFTGTKGGTERSYYPGVWEIDEALPIALIARQPLNIEFRLPKLVTGSISVRVLGPEGYQLDRFEFSQPGKFMQALDGPVEKIDHLREGRYLFEARGSAEGKQYAGFKQVGRI